MRSRRKAERVNNRKTARIGNVSAIGTKRTNLVTAMSEFGGKADVEQTLTPRPLVTRSCRKANVGAGILGEQRYVDASRATCSLLPPISIWPAWIALLRRNSWHKPSRRVKRPTPASHLWSIRCRHGRWRRRYTGMLARMNTAMSVSYTHLTLPTILRV